MTSVLTDSISNPNFEISQRDSTKSHQNHFYSFLWDLDWTLPTCIQLKWSLRFLRSSAFHPLATEVRVFQTIWYPLSISNTKSSGCIKKTPANTSDFAITSHCVQFYWCQFCAVFGPGFSHNGIPFFLHENMSWTNCHVTSIQRAMINPPSLHGLPITSKEFLHTKQG